MWVRRTAVAALLLVATAGVAEDDDGLGDTFQGESAAGVPLEGVPDEARKDEAMPDEALPLDEPDDSRITDSEAEDGIAVERRPREMLAEDDDDGSGGLKEAEPVDDDGDVEPGPRVMEKQGKDY